ncbi:MAG: HAD-IA family hydrolase [Lachnospiraceae bacterium]|nr:HAD-IA family hydrolase [Lachnospiraceae bacterium]
MKYELIIFDMDGTILDTLEDLQSSLNHALALSGFAVRSLDEVRSFVGNGIGKLIERSLPASNLPAHFEKVYGDFMAHYTIHCTDLTRPYAGIPQLISTLRKKGCQTAVVSNKADAAVGELCRRYFPGLFDYAIGEREGLARKPEADLVNFVLKELNCPKEKTVYIGDSEVDIATAQNAGLDAIIVDWGFRDTAFLKKQGAKTIASSPEEILALLE